MFDKEYKRRKFMANWQCWNAVPQPHTSLPFMHFLFSLLFPPSKSSVLSTTCRKAKISYDFCWIFDIQFVSTSTRIQLSCLFLVSFLATGDRPPVSASNSRFCMRYRLLVYHKFYYYSIFHKLISVRSCCS